MSGIQAHVQTMSKISRVSPNTPGNVQQHIYIYIYGCTTFTVVLSISFFDPNTWREILLGVCLGLPVFRFSMLFIWIFRIFVLPFFVDVLPLCSLSVFSSMGVAALES